MTVGRIRTCSKSFSVRLPPESVRAAQMCGYSAHNAPTCKECEAIALLFMCLRLPRLCYFLLSLCSAALAPAPSSHSAALTAVLHLTLPCCPVPPCCCCCHCDLGGPPPIPHAGRIHARNASLLINSASCSGSTQGIN